MSYRQEWKLAIGSGDLEKYRKFLKEADLSDSDNTMEATALENALSLKEVDLLPWIWRGE